MNFARRVEWMSVVAFVLTVFALVAVVFDWLTQSEATLVMIAAVVCAILSLRGR